MLPVKLSLFRPLLGVNGVLLRLRGFAVGFVLLPLFLAIFVLFLLAGLAGFLLGDAIQAGLLVGLGFDRSSFRVRLCLRGGLLFVQLPLGFGQGVLSGLQFSGVPI